MSLASPSRRLQLQQRRQRLVGQSQARRAALGNACAALAQRLHGLDLAWRAAVQVRRRPWLLALPVLAWVGLGRHRIVRVAAWLPLLLRLVSTRSG